MEDGRRGDRRTISRRHAAILAADVVDYGRVMADDEVDTCGRVKALLSELFEPTVLRHGGRIVRMIGDGALVELAGVPDAVACAVEVQKALAQRDEGVGRARRIALQGIAFSPAGGRVVTASDDGTARIWDVARGARLAPLPVEVLIAEAKRRLPRQLTPEQAARFFLASE